MKFKKRYVLGTGWILPFYQHKRGILAGLQSEHGDVINLKFPIEVEFDRDDAPRYRIVLERVDRLTKKVNP